MTGAFRGERVRKLLEITTGRHPFQVATVAACPLSAIAIMITGDHPASLDAALPRPFADVWLVILAAGGVVATVGAYWTGDLDTGLITEGAGVALLASMLTIYAAALFLVNGGAGLGAGSFLLAIAVAGWWRAGQTVRDVIKVWRAQREGLTANVRTLIDPGTSGGAP